MSDFMIESGGIVRGKQTALENVSPNIGQAIFDSLSEDPTHVAQIEADTGYKTTFIEMKDKSIRCALWMQKQNLGPDDTVVVCTDNRSDAYVPVLATFFVEAIFCPWNPNLTPDSTEILMKLYRPKLIFACKSALTILKNASNALNIPVKFIVFEEGSDMQSLDDIMQLQANKEVKRYTARNLKGKQDVSAILLTSGSTGFSKGVMHSSRVLVDRLYPDILSLRGKLCLWYSMLDWVSAIIYTLTCIFNRSTRLLHLCNQFEVEEACKVIQKYKINHVLIPSFRLYELSKFDDIKKYDLRSLDSILTGGSISSTNVFESVRAKCPNTRILHAYGMTELGYFSHLRTDESITSDSFGPIQFNIEAKIINPETGAILLSNEPGELCMRTPNMMLGYYKNPEETQQTIDQEGWLHTGDQCYYNDKGEFFFVSRLKELMKYRNFRITPAEIEEILMTHPAVLEVAVVPVPHEIDGDWPMAFIRIVPGSKVSKEELIALSSILGDNRKLRGGVEFLEIMPKTASGKISKTKLKEFVRNNFGRAISMIQIKRQKLIDHTAFAN